MALDAKAKAMRRAGIQVISLAVGEPDNDTPEPIKAAAIQAIREGATKYTEAAGTPELRAAIVEKFRRDQGLEFSVEEVCVTSGAKQAVYNALQVLLDPGDEVLILAPYWVSYPDMARLAGGVPVTVAWTDGFQVDLDDLGRKISPRSRVTILNPPNNPTGAVAPRAVLERVAEMALKHGLTILSDEIYEKLVYAGARHLAIASLSKEIAARTVTVNGCSKAYAMTGWRLGYAAGPKGVLAAMITLQSQSTSCVAGFVQRAAIQALRSGDAEIASMVLEFDRRRKTVLSRVRAWPGARAAEPQGAFFVFAEMNGVLGGALDGSGPRIADDLSLSELLLNEARVAVVPGTPFGAPGHLRLSYAASLEVLEKACDAVDAVLRRLR